MLRDPVSNPIRWLMLVSAICLIIFLYNFTAKSINYLDTADAQSDQIEKESAKILKKHRATQQQKANLMPNYQSIDEP